MKDQRKPWQKAATSYRFARCGTMTAETAAAWRQDGPPASEFTYAKALGISVEEARARIAQQQAELAVTDIQEDLGL